MIIKLIDQLRKWKTDSKKSSISWAEIENYAKKFDEENKREWEKLKILKDRQHLENKKLEIEISNLKRKSLYFTEDNQSFRLSDVIAIKLDRRLNSKKQYIVQLKNTADIIYLSDTEVEELREEK